MAKEVLFYGMVTNFNVASFIQSVQTILEETPREDLDLRLNTSGGDVFAGWGFVAKFREFPNQKVIQVDGEASSMGAVFLLFSSFNRALPQSNFILHRAATFFMDDEAIRKILKNINDEFRKAFEEKIDVQRFEEIAGVTLDRFFDMDQSQIDVALTAQEALEIGLIDEIVELSATEIDALNKTLIAAQIQPITKERSFKPKAKKKKKSFDKPLNNNSMTKEELKSEHPDIYAQIYGEGVQAGVDQEKDRAGAWAAFIDIDPEKVAEGIKGGGPITQTAMAEFSRKALNAQHGKNLEGENANTARTGDPENNNGGEGSENNEGDPNAKTETQKFEDTTKEILARKKRNVA